MQFYVDFDPPPHPNPLFFLSTWTMLFYLSIVPQTKPPHAVWNWYLYNANWALIKNSVFRFLSSKELPLINFICISFDPKSGVLCKYVISILCNNLLSAPSNLEFGICYLYLVAKAFVSPSSNDDATFVESKWLFTPLL